uniref:rhomboid family intramembrane serine protease n=1 Tax=Dactylococcopsis salina TaxID=292566 RepID=UPI0002E37092
MEGGGVAYWTHAGGFIFYLSCGALAALAQWFFSVESEVPLLGASGAIAGVMGAYILRFPTARILTFLANPNDLKRFYVLVAFQTLIRYLEENETIDQLPI